MDGKQNLDAEKHFPCPRCSSLRDSHLADCPFCGWTHREPTAGEAPNSTAPPCPLCGSRRYVWGSLAGGRIPPLSFVEDDGSIAHQLGFGGEEVRARKCLGCGNLQLFAEDSR